MVNKALKPRHIDFNDEEASFTFRVIMNNKTVEICHFSVTQDQRLHIEVREGIPMTEAARQFIAIVKDQLDQISTLEMTHLSPSGDN